MNPPGTRLNHRFRGAIEALGIRKSDIARRYGCTDSFIHQVLGGWNKGTPRLEALMEEMIDEARGNIRRILGEAV